MYIFLKIHYHS